MNLDTLQNTLYEHRGSPEILLEAYKLGCRDERESAKNPHRKINQDLAAMTAAKNKAVEALQLYIADCDIELLDFNDDTRAAANQALAELEKVK